MPEERDRPTDLPLGDWWEDFRIALGFLTRLPIATVNGGTSSLARASRCFPLAGVVIGAIAGAAYAIAADLDLPPLIAAAIAVASSIVVTGALHEDGLADSADALGVRGGREAKLGAMRDSRIGAFGVLALGFSVLLRILALGAIGQPAGVFAALIAAHAWARAPLPWVMHSEATARQDGLAVAAGRPSRQTAGVALIIGAVILVIALGPATAFAAVIAGGLAQGLVPLARRELGGVTGDVLGAIEQLAETLILLAIVAFR